MNPNHIFYGFDSNVPAYTNVPNLPLSLGGTHCASKLCVEGKMNPWHSPWIALLAMTPLEPNAAAMEGRRRPNKEQMLIVTIRNHFGP